jgi:hypothetical protein
MVVVNDDNEPPKEMLIGDERFCDKQGSVGDLCVQELQCYKKS